MISEKKVNNLQLILFALGLLIKPFYLLPSGSLQIGDLFFMLAFIITISVRKAVIIVNEDKPLIIYLSAVVMINGIYLLKYQYNGFINATLYLIFNLFVILILRDNHEKKMMIVLSICSKINILIQLLIFLIGKGRWLGAYRYQGTFNDPNQFAFAILSWYLIVFTIDNRDEKNKKSIFLYYILSLFLIFKSNSMGMMFGLLLILITDLIFGISKIKSEEKRNLYIIFMIICLAIMGIFLMYVYTSWSTGELSSIEMFRRLTRKSVKYGGGWFYNFVKDRNLENYIYHPEVILYGGGGSHMERFAIDGDTRELHSTWLALLYYYGIIPFCFLITWVKRNIQSIDKIYYAPIITMMIESITLVNFRQPTFWILFVLVGYCSKKNEKKQYA